MSITGEFCPLSSLRVLFSNGCYTHIDKKNGRSGKNGFLRGVACVFGAEGKPCQAGSLALSSRGVWCMLGTATTTVPTTSSLQL